LTKFRNFNNELTGGKNGVDVKGLPETTNRPHRLFGVETEKTCRADVFFAFEAGSTSVGS
jgi:hypothetical protein